MTGMNKTRDKLTLMVIRKGPMGIQDVPGSLHSTECIRCLERLETCARDEALTLWIGK